MSSNNCSLRSAPMNCKPIGNPPVVKPHGTEIAGSPARFAGRFRRNSRARVGWSIFARCAVSSPISVAAIGVVGTMSASIACFSMTSRNWKMKFRANRSLRDVEASVNLWVRSLDNIDLDEDQ